MKEEKKECKMKTKILLLVSLLVVSYVFLSALTFADLDIDVQYLVKDFIIDYDEEITEMNFSTLEGLEYEIVYECDDYVVVEIDGIIYIVQKD